MTNRKYRAEIPVASATALLLGVLAAAAPEFFSRANLIDLFLANMPVMIIALGMTLVILTARIDISVGSAFAVCGVVAGELAKAGLPAFALVLIVCTVGCALGAASGALVAYARIPSIVVTLAAMVSLREGLRWYTQGAWVKDLPTSFQWLGWTQGTYPVFTFSVVAALTIVFSAGLRHLAAGRAIYATGSHEEAARLAGIDTHLLVFLCFALTGALAGFAALLNSVRFNQIPTNAGLGLELQVVAAVVVGGTSITGGRGSIAGTVLGVILLGIIGTALTFLGVSAYWERAIQGVIILAAAVIDVLRARSEKHAGSPAASIA